MCQQLVEVLGNAEKNCRRSTGWWAPMCKLKGSGTANHSHDPSPTAVIFAIDSSKTASLGTLTICIINSAWTST
jgi:hypothetical protein